MIKKRKNVIPEFNTTALPDIIFMLLFFFMVVTVIKNKDSNYNIQLPKVAYGEKIIEKTGLIDISIFPDKKDNFSISYRNSVYSNLENFEQDFIKTFDNYNYREAKLRIDGVVPMEMVNNLKTILQKTKIYSIEYIVTKSS